MYECMVLQKKEKMANPVATINNTSSSTSSTIYVQDSYQPFISGGFLSVQVNDTPIPTKNLCDTGASQSLLVEGVLPLLSDESTTGDHILIKVSLTSDLTSGYVTENTHRPSYERCYLIVGK